MKRCIVVIVIVAIIGVAFLLFINSNSSSDMTSNMGIALVDENGNVITELTWLIDGKEAAGFLTTVTFDITGTEFRLETVHVECDIKFYVVEYFPGGDKAETLMTSYSNSKNSALSGTFSKTWYFANWLDTSVNSEWSIKVVGELLGEADDAYNQAMEATWTDYYTFDVTWLPDAGTFSIDGTISGP